jgi:hypothetical protein
MDELTGNGFDPKNSLLVRQLYDCLVARWDRYYKLDRYMGGEHFLKFATEKFTNAFGGLFRELANNYCGRVVTTLSDYVQLDDVKFGDEALNTEFDQWMDAQRIDAQQGRLHKNAFLYGDGYAIVAPDALGNLRLYRQEARNVEVMYDPEQPERLLLALKIWRTLRNTWRLNVYTLDGTYRLETPPTNINIAGEKDRAAFEAPAGLAQFQPIVEEPFVASFVPGVIPVFHWANEPDITGRGVSELNDIMPLQDALNKSLCDMMVTMEFQAYRQRWATGIEQQYDESGKPKPISHGADRLLWTPSTEAKFGEFSPVDLTQFLAVAEGWRTEIARLSRVPPHHLSMTENFPSGEALKTAEAPLIAKVKDRQVAWGNTWEDVAAYWYRATKGADVRPGSIEAEWDDTTPRSRKEDSDAEATEWETAGRKHELGVPLDVVLEEMGYSKEQIARFKTMRAAEDNTRKTDALAYLAANEGGNALPPATPAL